jgi:hypothetical protein
MSFDRCVNNQCLSRHVIGYPEGSNASHPWLLTHHCTTCHLHWFSCNGMCRTTATSRKTKYYNTIRNATRHYNSCHIGKGLKPPPTVEELALESSNEARLDEYLLFQSRRTTFHEYDTDHVMEQSESDYPIDGDFPDRYYCDSAAVIENEDNWHTDEPLFDGDAHHEFVETDIHYEPLTVPMVEQCGNPQRFEQFITNGKALSAASVLVSQAAHQNPMPFSSILPRNNIMLFLYLAQLVMSSGVAEKQHLAKVLLILYPYVDTEEKEWAPIPCTVSGFRSKITNVSNSNSLVSILPIPSPETLPDGHGYTPFRDILGHALMMNSFIPADIKDPKWNSLVSSEKFQTFLAGIPTPIEDLNHLQIAVGIIVWTDGWDTSTGCKSNRSPMHTGTVTLVFVSVITGQVVGLATYPNMGGPGKIDHGPVFRRFQEDLAAYESSDIHERIFPSRHHSCDVEIHTQIMFVVQDQPERRQASGLLGGGSHLHALFGTSCDFIRLELPFEACIDCQSQVHDYIAAKDWSAPPLINRCDRCLSWDLDHLTNTTYTESYPRPNNLPPDAPGFHLFDGPGELSCSLLLECWNYCIDMFAIRHLWVEADVKKYLYVICLNEATITNFVDTCRRHVTLQDTFQNGDDYTAADKADLLRDSLENPSQYKLPQPPAMWLLGEIEDKPEGIMHLSMGIQKAVFKFIIRWANGNRNGAALQRRLASSLAAVQDLKLSYCPCRPYKDEKFGGFTAEVYRAMTMISGFLYLCLLEEDLEPSTPRGPNPAPQREWTKQDNINWMYRREVEYSSTITLPESKEQVRRLLATTRQLPIVRELPTPITTEQIRDLVWRTHNLFRAIFCSDISGLEARNRASAAVMRFLSQMETLDLQLNPKRAQPIWIAKFNFLGLLRVCGSFTRFKHVRNLYEGGVIGEGIVKILRPLVAKGVHQRWATNLLLAHYRQSTLEIMIQAAEEPNEMQPRCPLGDDVERTKFKRYTTAAEVIHEMSTGRPLPVLIYGSSDEWMAGAIIVTQNRWYFREIHFVLGGEVFEDQYGPTYFRVRLVDEEICLGVVGGVFEQSLGPNALLFWDYATLLPDTIHDTVDYRYSIERSGWQHLTTQHEWSEFE